MKRLIWVIGWIWLTGFHLASGQVVGSWGVKGGVALSNQSYRITSIDYVMETAPIFSPQLALFMEAFRGDHFSLQTDLTFACRGSSTTTKSVTVNHLEADRLVVSEGDPATSRHRYLTLAPMLRARTGQDGLVPYALFGPRLDIFLYYTSQSEYPLEEQNKLILGLSMGVGLEYGLSNKSLFAEIQFQPDLSPVTNKDPLLVNNNSLVLTLGVRWIKEQ